MTWDRFLTFTEMIHVEAYLQRILKKGNLDQKKPKLHLPKVLGMQSVAPVKLDMEKDIQQAVSEAFDNIHIDDTFNDPAEEVALADSQPSSFAQTFHSPAQRTEENLMRAQLGLATVGGVLNFNVVLLALLLFE